MSHVVLQSCLAQMHPAASLIVENVVRYQNLVIPLLFICLSAVANAHSPVQHSLLVTAVSWAGVWISTIFRTGLWSTNGSRSRKTTSWVAGGLFALAHICDRAACDKEGIWSTKGYLVVVVVLLYESDFVSKHIGLPSHFTPDETVSDGSSSPARSYRLFAIASISAVAALSTRYKVSPTLALGICSVVFTATGLVLFEGTLKSRKDDTDTNPRGLVSANGSFSRRYSLGAQKEQQLASLRDVAIVITAICGVAACILEPPIAQSAVSWTPAYRHLWGNWKTMHYHLTLQQCLVVMTINVIVNSLLFFMLSHHGVVHTTFFSVFSYICARLNLATSFSGIWFTIVFGSTSLLFLYDSSISSAGDVRNSIRFRRIIFGVTAISLGLLVLRVAPWAQHATGHSAKVSAFDVFSPDTPFAPVPIDIKKGHPAEQLIKSAESEFEVLLSRQSKSLAEAVQEYRRRNGIPPPPHFDKWYEFATRNNIQLVDEFDTITQSLLPFWAVKPSTIRARVKLALASHEENALVVAMVRNGNVVKIENGPEWQQQATVGMMKKFVQYLPDMDLAFNIHDEPRVVVPNDQLSVLVAMAKNQTLASAMTNASPRNRFSPRPADLSDGKRLDEATTSRFNRFAHQQTWTHARLSCPVTSQARNYEDQAVDNLTSYATAPLNYIYNHTAFSDICNSPSLASRFGFFERPNAFNIIHELTPIFSQSKISSFQDIIYPSPWYWFGKVGYDSYRDTSWENKTNSLYWRGSTTGGFSRNGGWRRQHRQHVVRRLNAPDTAKVLVNKGDDTEPRYEVEEVERRKLAKYVDVMFSHVGQCDPGDCNAQKEFFKVVEHVDGQDAWYYKHLLDMDGNAFSGRFYAFLKSRSLTFKMSVFREWHQEWLKPWVHYVPISLIGDEHLDLVRWFGGGSQRVDDDDSPSKRGKDNKGGNGGSVGETKAREIAERSTEWTGKVLRNVDFEAWFFRLLLEYGRVIDDDRESIGYPGP